MRAFDIFSVTVFSMCALCGGQPAAAGDWKVLGEQIAPIPLPFQAARLRIVVRYSGAMPSAPTNGFPGSMFKEARLPDSAAFRKIIGSFQPGIGKDGSRLAILNASNPQIFRPGDELSMSVSFAGQFEGSPEIAILFRQPGTYELKTGGFEPRVRHNVPIFSDPIPVVVKTPEGEDKAIYQQLVQDETLVYALLVPMSSPSGAFIRDLRPSLTPTNETIIPALRRLIADHPKSPYADYARFALARWHFYDEKDGNIYSASKPLEAIDHENFAYGDYSLSLLRQVLHSTGSQDEAVPVAARLDKAFPDGLERLEDLAGRVSQEQWNKLNPRKPVPHQKADK